jgi:hypothetical protein
MKWQISAELIILVTYHNCGDLIAERGREIDG